MSVRKAIVNNAGEDQQIQSGDYLDGNGLGSGYGGAGTKCLADNNTWVALATGTVSSTSVVSANGFAGTVATSTTTPAITLTTSVTGLVYGNGTALSAATISTGLTLSTSTLTANLSVGVSGGQSAIGGTAVGDALTFKGTTANGTSTVASLVFTVGNNGATNAMNIYNSGQVLVNGTTVNPGSLGIFRVLQGTSTIDIGEVSSGKGAIWLSQSTPSTTNYTLQATTSTTINAASANLQFAVANIVQGSTDGFSWSYSPTLKTSGATIPFTFTTGRSTNQTLSTEVNGFKFTQTTDRQWATGALTLQREFLINAPTYRFVGASTITDAVSFEVTGAPAVSTNATFTRAWAARLLGNTAIGGSVMVGIVAGTTAPTALLHLAAGTATASTAPIKLTSGTNLTSAEAGVLAEYDGTNFYGTPNTTVGRWAHSFNSIQYTTPTTGATIVSTAGIAQLVVNPAGTLLALTITFPPSPINGQTFGVGISQIITTLTLNTSDGSTIDGTITTSSTNSNGGWIYSSIANIWFKIH